jgi:hypothetical protein
MAGITLTPTPHAADESVYRQAAVKLGRELRRKPWMALGVAGIALLVYCLSVSSTHLTAPRLVQTSPTAKAPNINWLGVSIDTWVPIFYGVTALVIFGMVRSFFRHWAENGRMHPGWPIFLALGVIGPIFDPIWNWCFYCNYYPKLLHWPVNWWDFNTAPTVEPWWIILGAYQAFYLGPALLGFAIHRRFIAGRAKDGSFVRRHPVAALVMTTFVVGAVMDVLMEMWMINIGIYKYTQIWGPYLSMGRGHLQGIEILWCAVWTAFLCVLLRRDDRGRSGSARIATAWGVFRNLRFGEMATAFTLVFVVMMAYGGTFVATRLTGDAKVVPGTYPYTQMVRTYDPDGAMQKAGQPGPYYKGTWAWNP